MTLAQRLDLPIGVVPEYDVFKRHVWSYESMSPVRSVTSPPWMYSMIFDDPREFRMAWNTLRSIPEARTPRHRCKPAQRECDGSTIYEIAFADLEILHAFLQQIARHAEKSLALRQIGEVIMYTLGFRWV